MRPFELICIDNIYCEIFFQLPCMSLTPFTWMPLDKIIQELIWSSCDIKDKLRIINPVCLYIYRLCWAVFKDKGFSAYTCEVLRNNRNVLDEKIFYECLSKVFFNFSDELISLLNEELFDEIIPHYRKFNKY